MTTLQQKIQQLTTEVASGTASETVSSAGSPKSFSYSTEKILDLFLEYVNEKNLQLYPAQEEAVLEIFSGKNVILNTPTGSGKSLVALALHFDSVVRKRRSYYTSPIKALVNEKFFALCKDFGPESVGMITGDSTVNAEAPIICCTAEILAMQALRDGNTAPINDVVMDEFHYYSDRERGVAWQIPLLCLPQTRMLLMSATMGDSERFQNILTNLNSLPSVIIKSTERPVPLEFSYSEIPLHECVADLIKNGRAPIYLVSFSQRECAEEIQNFMSVDLCTKDEKAAISEALIGFKFSSPYGKELQRFLKHGMGLHHAGLLPKYRILVERLAQKGLLKIIFGTDTLGVGVNVPLRTVLFTKLCKFDGSKSTLLSVRDFQQIAGRAGRKGFDHLGTVVAQAPEHLIENKRNELKAAGDPKKLKKLVKKKPPERGYVPWSQDTFQRLIQSEAEPLTSRFKVNHAMLLQVLSRPNEDGCRAMQKIISSCHESPEQKKKLFQSGFELFRSLVDRQIIEFNPLRINVNLQEDFSLNHALSLYLIDTHRLLDINHPDYALDTITLTESILESPDIILRKQLDRLKSEKMAEMKAAGMEYEERLEELEKLEHPKPLREFIYNSFNEFARQHPWIENENIRPKSIAREMYEGFYSFADYIKEYDLQRAEGLLLRYLSDFYKALSQNVPDIRKTDSIYEVEIYFETIIRQIDSSLLDEWERMKTSNSGYQGGAHALGISSAEKGQSSSSVIAHPNAASSASTRLPEWDQRTLMIQLRNLSFQFLKYLALGNFEAAFEMLSADHTNSMPLNPDHLSSSNLNVPNLDCTPPSDLILNIEYLEQCMNDYYQSGHSQLLTDFKARSTEFVRITPHHTLHEPQIHGDNQTRTPSKASSFWLVEQRMTDTEENNDWVIELIAKAQIISSTEKSLQLTLKRIGPLF